MRHEAQRFGTAVDAVVHAKNNAVEAATHPTHIPSIVVDNAKAFFVDDVAGTAVSAATGVYDSVRSVYDGVTTKGLKGYLNESVGTIPHFGQVSRGASLGATLPIELLGLAYGGEGAGGAVGTAARELPGVTGRSISDAERAATEGAAASMPPTTRDAQTTRAAEAVQDIAPQEKYGGCQSCQRAHERVEDNSAARGADSRSGSDAAFLRMLTRQLRAPIPDDVVHYGPHATGIGITPNIPRDVAESRGRSGLHDVFVHGDETGLPTIAAEYRNPFLIAQKIRENPSYEEGQGIRLFQCYGERSCATGLRAALGVDVLASRAAVGTVNGRLAVGGGNADAAEIARINEIEYRASREFTDRQRHNFLSTSAPSTR